MVGIYEGQQWVYSTSEIHTGLVYCVSVLYTVYIKEPHDCFEKEISSVFDSFRTFLDILVLRPMKDQEKPPQKCQMEPVQHVYRHGPITAYMIIVKLKLVE